MSEPDDNHPRRVLMLLDNPCHPDRRVQKEAASLVAAGDAVTILAWDRSAALPRRDSTGGASIMRLRVASRNNRGLGQVVPTLRFWAAAFRCARRMQFDVVHCHDLPTLPVGLALKLVRGTPLVYDVHEIYPLMMRTRLPRALCGALAMLERSLMRRASHVVTVSSMLAEHYARTRSDIAIVGNWYDPFDLDATSGRALRRRLGVADDAFLLAYVGYFGPERLHGLLLEYARAHPEVAVVIAGTGAGEREVAAADKELPNLHFLGLVADPADVFAAADALFYGLADDDPYSAVISPNNLFQAIAMRRPLIAVGPGDATRVVAATGAGIAMAAPTVAALHAAVRELGDPECRRRVDDAQLRLQQSYSWQRAAAVLLGVYDAAARRTAHRAEPAACA
jgi:glycosyltransferase involved in cell wall biosynthesis